MLFLSVVGPLVFSLSSKFHCWKLIYIPYGISHYWSKPSGQATYLPVGGGVQYSFDLVGIDLGASVQGFEYVLRSDKGPKRELRMMPQLDF